MAAPRMSCRAISPSPALSVASLGVKRTTSRLPILPVGWRAHCFPRLRLRPGETGAHRRSLAVRAQNHGANAQLPEEPNHFLAERKLILSCFSKIFSLSEGYLYREATDMSAELCMLAGKALRIASRIVDSASLNLGAPNEISMDTIHMTLRVYVDVFVHAADDSYNRRVNTKTVMSFLRALKGLGSVSHILLEVALEALSHTHPRESLLQHAFNYDDVKTMHREFNRKMDDLQDGFRKASTCELLMPTIYEGVKATEAFVGLMVARRQKAIEKTCSKQVE